MAFEAILDEVDQLHSVSARLEGLAEQHPPVLEALLTIAGNVRSAATVLAVLVATKLQGGDGYPCNACNEARLISSQIGWCHLPKMPVNRIPAVLESKRWLR